MVDLSPRCPDPRRQPHRWQEGGSLYRHATSDGCNYLAGPSHRQPPLSRTRHLRSLVASIGRDGDADVLPVEGAAAAATEPYGHIYSGGTAAGGDDGSGTCCSSTCYCSGDRHAYLPRCVVEGCGGSARIVSWRGIGGGTCSSAGDQRYCFPHCVGGGGGQGARFCRCNDGIDDGPGDRRYCCLRYISWGAPASSAVAAASEDISAAEPATSGTIPSAASIRGAVGERESSTGAVSLDAEAEAKPSTSGTAAPVASVARAARNLASAAVRW